MKKKAKTIDIISIISHSGYYAKMANYWKEFDTKIDIRICASGENNRRRENSNYFNRVECIRVPFDCHNPP